MDIHPGDRKSACGGLMEPVGVDQKNGIFFIIHRCVKCGYEKRNKTSREDDFEKVINLNKLTSL